MLVAKQHGTKTMPTLSPTIIHIFAPFAIIFSCSKTLTKAMLLMTGAILCKGGRTVCGALKVLGLQGERAFANYHRVLNRDQWNALEGAKILLLQIIKALGITELVIALDDHVERRSGEKIKSKGCYRDAVRSSRGFIVRCFGLKWVAMMVAVKLPWSNRTFALPFLTVLAPSKKANRACGKKHKTSVDWARQMCYQLRRWLPLMAIRLVVDGGFASAELAWTALKLNISLITRLRLDARIFDFPKVKSGPGRPAKRGRRLLAPKTLLQYANTPWQETEVQWYRGRKKKIQYVTTTCLWSPIGGEAIPIRLVVIKDPAGRFESAALMSTDVTISALVIIEEFVKRWAIEVTFREVREHLGVETQRQWSDKAIARETPALFALYSIVILIGLQLGSVPIRTAAWYSKQSNTFSDILVEVRRILWRERYFEQVVENRDLKEIFTQDGLMDEIINHLAEAV
jgi:hypothetical protein